MTDLFELVKKVRGEAAYELWSEVVIQGLLPAKVSVPTEVKSRGLLGLFGRKEPGKPDINFDGRLKLRDIVSTTDGDDAYFLRLGIRSEVKDSKGAICPYPS